MNRVFMYCWAYLLCLVVIPACSPDHPNGNSPLRQVEQALVGRWIIQTGPDRLEILEFGEVNQRGEGLVQEVISSQGQVVSHLTGQYRIHRNPLLNRDEQIQIHVHLTDNNWGHQKREFIIKSLRENTLVLGGLYTAQSFTYQRADN